MDRRLVHARLADAFWAASADTRYGEARRIDVDKSIAALRRSIRRAASTHLHASIVVFDEALQFLIHLEATLLEYALGQTFAFAALVSRQRLTPRRWVKWRVANGVPFVLRPVPRELR